MAFPVPTYVTQAKFDTGTPLVTASVDPAANELWLVFVGTRLQTQVSSISGTGLTWAQVAMVQNPQNAHRIYVWRGLSTSDPAAGAISITMTGNNRPAIVLVVKVTGADTGGTDGSAAVEDAQTASVDAVTDTDDMKVTVTTSGADRLIMGFGSHRNRTFTAPTGQAAVSTDTLNEQSGSGGDIVGLSIWFDEIASAGTHVIGADNDLNLTTEWSMVGISIKPAGATIHEQTMSGALTPAGANVKTAGKVFTGSTTPAGVLVKTMSKILAGTVSPTGALETFQAFFVTLVGSISPVGALSNAATKVFAGAVTPSGIVLRMPSKLFAGEITPAGTLLKTTGLALSGMVAPVGSLNKTISKFFAGAITPAGEAVKTVGKVFSGGITPTGALDTLRSLFINLAGAIEPVGTLRKTTTKMLGGTIEPSGAMLKTMAKILAGSITPTGVLTTLRSFFINLAGAISPNGSLTKTVGKALGGTLTPSGVVVKATSKVFAGVLSFSGSLTTGGGTVAGIMVEKFRGMYRGMWKRMR